MRHYYFRRDQFPYHVLWLILFCISTARSMEKDPANNTSISENTHIESPYPKTPVPRLNMAKLATSDATLGSDDQDFLLFDATTVNALLTAHFNKIVEEVVQAKVFLIELQGGKVAPARHSLVQLDVSPRPTVYALELMQCFERAWIDIPNDQLLGSNGEDTFLVRLGIIKKAISALFAKDHLFENSEYKDAKRIVMHCITYCSFLPSFGQFETTLASMLKRELDKYKASKLEPTTPVPARTSADVLKDLQELLNKNHDTIIPVHDSNAPMNPAQDPSMLACIWKYKLVLGIITGTTALIATIGSVLGPVLSSQLKKD